MIYDSHSHTEFSSDSDMKATDAVQAADRLGIGLVFTEHYDFDYVESPHYKDMDFVFDPQKYWRQYEPLRGNKLLLGVELGLTPGSIEANKRFIKQVPFDQVIGSIHAINKLDIYYPDYYENKTKREAYACYLKNMADMVKANPYIDILGHIDYICRYAPYEDKEIDYTDLHDLVDLVIMNVLDTGTVMELNTRRLDSKTVAEALLPIYRRYRELGGEYIAIGSDAHKVENLGMNFPMAIDLAEFLGLKPVYFRERRIEYT
ncbi:MAG: histidinol-phosphatase HisJ family protein [Anaerovibrio sp.]|uniref:histidinol-phosphatase HisJ family protein n=1 Tax=Anaerovibrio sp. TaxID=1872532 RepID=UPI0025CD3AF3|nr:histidinol-phosphatase HisJ family protein [Anaerovibrio sp.]MCR5176489.1 histidinol-phosphatase HisJ family protein [Anaerovibrio sp.]